MGSPPSTVEEVSASSGVERSIEALLARGDRASARRRALSLVSRYPESPHVSTVRKALKWRPEELLAPAI
jgi:hypothetical protein